MAVRSIDTPPASALPLHNRLALYTCLLFTAIAVLIPPHASPTSAPMLIGTRLLLTAANYVRMRIARKCGCCALKRCGRASQAPPCTAPAPALRWKRNR